MWGIFEKKTRRRVKPEQLRPDGSKKDRGFLGPKKVHGGGVATEYSVGVPINGKEMDIPTLVPTLNKAERTIILKDVIPNRKKLPKSVVSKAAAHAKKRIKEGKSPFFDSRKDRKK